jgi:hypothetical protein
MGGFEHFLNENAGCWLFLILWVLGVIAWDVEQIRKKR